MHNTNLSMLMLVSCYHEYCEHNNYCVVCLGDAGRHNDSGVFANSAFGQALDEDRIDFPDDRSLPGQCMFVYTHLPTIMLKVLQDQSSHMLL